MAGLQYNFFPTDFYYPRSQSLSDPSGVAATTSVTIPTRKKEVSGRNDDLEWPISLGFRVHQAKSTEPKIQRGITAYVEEDQSELVEYYPDPLSLFNLIPEQLSESS